MLSELIAIPEDSWTTRAGYGTPAEIAAMALAIERRRAKRVPLPRESERYGLVCDRLGDVARELLERGSAVRIWSGDANTTLRWVILADHLPYRARPMTRDLQIGLFRTRATFVPPPFVAKVVSTLEWLIESVVGTWPDAPEVLPILTARLAGFRAAQTQQAATVEVMTS